MESTLSWMDYSRRERRRVMDVMSLLGEQDAVDELGIGTVRDAFSDLLFPGISTIQTRARYFLFIPWTYIRLEQRGVGDDGARVAARKREISLINGLARQDEADGVIGIEARNNLKRLPSEIYWQGLSAWGIRLFTGSRGQYHQHLDRHHRDGQSRVTDEHLRAPNWHQGLPDRPSHFPYRASFDLTTEESRYLMNRISETCTGSLLWFLLMERGSDAPDYPWEHPLLTEMPPALWTQLMHARNFSTIMHGAMLLYNFYLAQDNDDGELMSRYAAGVKAWWSELINLGPEVMSWDRKDFWRTVFAQNRRITHPTRSFVDTWIDLACRWVDRGVGHMDLVESDTVRNLLAHREWQIKRKRARLSNQRARERWGGASGTSRLDFRWRVARTILRDILQPLEEEADA